MSERIEIGIVAAMDREIATLVNGWARVEVPWGGQLLPGFRLGNTVVVCGGIGQRAARRAADATIETFRPALIVSTGFAGSIRRDLRAGDVFIPGEVLGETRQRYRMAFGTGRLLTMDAVAGRERKMQLTQQAMADGIDMEAIGVAQSTAQYGVPMAAVKAVTDDPNDETDFTAPYAAPQGFKTREFLMHVALRPQLWLAVGRLARNSSRATANLTAALRELINDRDAFARQHTTRASVAPGER